MANEKTLPNIAGSETISGSWRKLLTRDRNISTMFAGTEFTTDQTSDDVGRPNYRTDLNRLFFWDGEKFVDLFDTIGLDMFTYETDSPDIPAGVNTLEGVLDAIIRRNALNAVTQPAEGVSYTADGTTGTFILPRLTTNKYSLFVFIDGVKQEASTYDLAQDGASITFKVLPTRGETIEIIQHASLAEWDYSPIIDRFTGDGSRTVFNLSFEVLRPEVVSVNVAGVELQKNQFSVTGLQQITLNTAPANGAAVQVMSVGKTTLVTVSPNTIGTAELKNKSVTAEKLDDGIIFNINMIEPASITTVLLANQSVSTAKLSDASVTTVKVVDNAITEAKLSTAVQQKLNASGPDLSNYVTKTELNNKGYLTASSQTITDLQDQIGDIDTVLSSIIAG